MIPAYPTEGSHTIGKEIDDADFCMKISITKDSEYKDLCKGKRKMVVRKRNGLNMQNDTKMFNIKIKWCICLNTELEPDILESEVKWALEDIAKNKWARVDK